MNQTQTRSLRKRVLSLILAVVMAVSLLPISAFASGDSKASTTAATSDGYEYNIMFLDCGRKYYSVDSIKQIIDNASKAGFNYIQLAVGNDGLRFLLDDMSLTVNGVTYSTAEVTKAIQNGNTAYNKTFDNAKTEDTKTTCKYNPEKNELTQNEMNTIIAYAASKGMGVIPCVNTPGHMDAILSAANSLTGTTCSYNGSARTIDVTNNTAVAFTQALLQKYIDYFAGKGCQRFNMGADEYANDIYDSGSMGFGNLQSSGKYSYYVEYVNQLAKMIKAAGMKPMAFNDGIYFNNNTSSGTFDTDIIICYWSSGWSSYKPMPASELAGKGFKLINTNGDYYWVLGKTAKCSAAKAGGFDKTAFPGGMVSNPVGSMFCIWADYPGAETEASVISKTAATIAAFGKALPQVKKVETVESKTVTKDNVTVTAPGLTDLTVAAADAPAIDAAAEGKVVAYDVTPATASGSYKKNGTVTLPIPEGWDASRVRGFVQNEDGSITTVTGTPADGKFTFTVPHFSVLGVYELAANAATETKTINLTVGGTTTDTIDGEYPGTKLDDAVASVVGGEPTDKPGTTTYEPATLGKGTFYVSTTANDTAPTEQLTFEDARNGQYYIKNSAGEYVYPDASLGSSLRWTYSRGSGKETVNVTKSGNKIVISKKIKTSFLGFPLSTTAYLTLNGTEYSASDSAKDLYLYKQKTTPGGKETTLTFTGKSAGTTTVTIGSVKYNIIVSDKAPDDALTADTITLEHWITNARVAATSGATGDDRNVQKISKTTAGIQSEDGVAVEKLAYTPYGYWGDTKVYYWQGMKLDKNNVQTDASGDDETADGTTLTHIRYYGNAWQYKTADETWHYFQNTDQFVIYYLQKTEVTKEVDTYVKDWGFDTKETTKDWSDGKGQVALTIAVVYPNGTVSPVESSMYSNSTIIYNYVDGRDIGIVAPKNNSDYNIAKITVTDGTRDSNSSSNVWYPYDTITWDKTTDSATGKTWYNETEVWNKSSGTTPMVNGKNSNITWAAKNTAKLVLIYLETVERETNLNVVYWDDNAGVKITGSQIAMKFTQGDTEPSFKTDLKGVTAGVTSWPSKEKSSSDYLPDTAYVTNSSGVDQTFNKDLVTVPGVTGVYTSGLYEYVSADISDDGKTLTLHYNLRQVEGKTYVLDFGLPIEIPITDFFAFENDSLKNSVTDISFESSTSVTEKQGEYGKGKIDKSTGIVTYTLTKALDSKVAIPVFVTLNDAAKTVKRLQVYIIPATSVYYEDSFATFTNANGTKNVAQVDNAAKGIWTKVTDGTTQTSVNQALEALGGTTNTKNVYGYDPAYDNSSKFSMGSATKVTVDANTANNGQWPTATFTFKGTGFDVISLTDNNSGAISVKVYSVGSDGTKTQVKGTLVNNYYGYTYADGKWEAAPTDKNNALYQVPVIKISDLPYGTYEVVITVSYATFADKTNDHQYSFWLDAIRVYDPAGKTLDTEYEQDNEKAPNYVEVKKVILDSKALETAGATGAVFIDGKGANGVTAADYKNQGPNHEAYLADGQAIAFQLIASAEPTSVQIGAKLASGNSAGLQIGGAACAKASNGTLTLNTATDMYYALTDMGWTLQNDGTYRSKVITLTNAGSGIISLTNLKFIGAKYTGSLAEVKSATSETNLVTLAVSSEMIDEALTAVDGALNPAPETFEPSHFEADWNRSVRAGQKATLTVKTSEDVDAITVDGQTITTYRTRTERTGWGWWSPRVTYRVFTYTTTAQATADYEVCALNSDSVASEPITATLTVKPAINWWHKWF